MEIHKLFRLMLKHHASDLHIKVGQPPVFRLHGKLTKLQNTPALSDKQVENLLTEVMTEQQINELEKRGNVDFATYLDEVGRFRCNVYKQCGYLSAAIRRVNPVVPTLEELLLPDVLENICTYKRGLVLIGGITGAGKSTTLASILNQINLERCCHILTLEDPIEYLFTEHQAIINQREVGVDVLDFHEALRNAVRQDPDVILIGEVRDAETIETALTAAETGHLVLGTIHASSCAQTINRILEMFPPERKDTIRTGLGFNLQTIINQQLLPGIQKDKPFVPAVEMMFVSPIIRKLLDEAEDFRIQDAIQKDQEYGSQTYNQAIEKLVNKKLINHDTAMQASPNPDELRIALRGISIQSGRGGIV